MKAFDDNDGLLKYEQPLLSELLLGNAEIVMGTSPMETDEEDQEECIDE